MLIDGQELITEYTFTKGSKWEVILYAGVLAFVYGPYEGPVIGEIATKLHDMKAPFLLRAYCGEEFDWQLAQEFADCVIEQAEP